MLDRVQRPGTDAKFTYDHTGLRMKKNVNGVETKYTLNGKTITHVQIGDSTNMHIFYDAQGRPSLLRHNGTDYAYLHNLQGESADPGAPIETMNRRIWRKSCGKCRHWQPVLTKYNTAFVNSRFGQMYSRNPEYSGLISAHSHHLGRSGMPALVSYPFPFVNYIMSALVNTGSYPFTLLHARLNRVKNQR